MTLRSTLSRFLFAALWVGCFALVLAGCDSNGNEDTTNSDTFEVTIENIGSGLPILKSGAFTPDDVINDNNNVPPLEPGEAFQFSFTAGPNEIPESGMRLSFASMFVQSNDVYYAFEPGGIALFDSNGNPIGMDSPADVTGSVHLFDAGTEVDQEPGTGADQAPRQDNLGDGTDEDGTITRIEENSDGVLEDDGFTYPAVAEGINMTVSSQEHADGGYQFTVTIENVGSADQVNGAPLVLSPGSYAVHWAETPSGDSVTYPGHTPGEEASDGIARIAEDGRPAGADGLSGNHVAALQELTGVTVPFSPGAFAVHSDEANFFETGEAASAGIERIAEDGMPGELVSMLSDLEAVKTVEAFNTPDGADEPGPLAPGNSYSFTVDAEPGDRLSFATMYIQSNDFFYAFAPGGLPLFTGSDEPISGDQTDQLRLYDAGTEVDQEPGVGLTQAPRQSEADVGTEENGDLVRVQDTDDDAYLDNDGFKYAPILNENGNSVLIKVTVTPQ